MSLTAFNNRARAAITVQVTGSGKFSPLPETYGQPLDWTLSGSVKAKEFDSTSTAKEDTCGLPNNSPKEFRKFSGSGSTGNTSGTISTGQIAMPPGPMLGRIQSGIWEVNTKPVLSTGGNADGDPVTRQYYVVGLPKDAKIDDPIVIDPAIDDLKRVYPGDFVYVSGVGEFARWRVAPQTRFPKPDRTFLWTPNTNPVLKSGGLVDGKRAKPGTIMLPTETYYIEDTIPPAPPAVFIDGLRYFLKDVGVYFDGQTWKVQYPAPLIYEPETGPKQFRNQTIGFPTNDMYTSLLEGTHEQKPFIVTNQTIDDSEPFQFVTTIDGVNETTNLYFRWGGTINEAPDNIQPGIPLLYNFGDAWSYYHQKTKDWILERYPGAYSAGFTLKSRNIEPETVLILGVDQFIDGNVTTIEQEVESPTGGTLKNKFEITLQATPSIE